MTRATAAQARRNGGAPAGYDGQPVSRVRWLDRGLLRANTYNPNKVFTPEMELLKLSILEDGWTQPLVVRAAGDEREEVYEIVDGFHRWSVSGDEEVRKLTGGYVPCVVLSPDPAGQMLSTVRHNRARGHHHVVKMADIVSRLVDDEGLDEEEIMRRLGMEKEEFVRLYQRGEMVKRGAGADFSKGWVPR